MEQGSAVAAPCQCLNFMQPGAAATLTENGRIRGLGFPWLQYTIQTWKCCQLYQLMEYQNLHHGQVLSCVDSVLKIHGRLWEKGCGLCIFLRKSVRWSSACRQHVFEGEMILKFNLPLYIFCPLTQYASLPFRMTVCRRDTALQNYSRKDQSCAKMASPSTRI